MVFMEQRAQGTLRLWAEPFTPLRVPKLFNLRTDPFERADITSNTYYDWFIDHAFMIIAAQALVGGLPRHRSRSSRRASGGQSFTIDQVLEKMEAAGVGRLLTTSDSPAASWTDTATRRAIVAFVERRDHGGRPGLRVAARAHRGLRQRRDAVVREADADPARLHAPSACRDGRRPTRRCATSSRGRRATSGTSRGSAPRWSSITTATTAT